MHERALLLPDGQLKPARLPLRAWKAIASARARAKGNATRVIKSFLHGSLPLFFAKSNNERGRSCSERKMFAYGSVIVYRDVIIVNYGRDN